MSYHNDDYLAKKIAEETVKEQKKAYNKAKIKRGRFILTGTCILFGLLGGFSVFLIPELLLIVITIIYWVWTQRFLDKHA